MNQDENQIYLYPLPARRKTSGRSKKTPLLHEKRTLTTSNEVTKALESGLTINLRPQMAEELQTCPFAFRQKYLEGLKIPRKLPSPSSRLSQNVRAALQIFYQRGGPGKLGLDELLNLLQSRWENTGFSSEEEELDYRQEARRQLIAYYEKARAEPEARHIAGKFQEIRGLQLGRHILNLSGWFDRIDLFPDGALDRKSVV